MTCRVAASALFTLALLALPAAPRAAGWVHPELLLTPDQVQANASKPDWVVVDCRDLPHYAKGHVPGAISFGKDCNKALMDPTSRVFKDVKRYESFLGKAGIGNDTHVVFYGEHKITDTLKFSTVGFWLMEYLGHDKAHVLNGGLDAWVKAGKQLTNEPTIKAERTFKARIVPSRYATTEEVLRIALGKEKGVTLIDARSKAEHTGEDIRALRGGSVPNTTANIPHTDTMDQEKDRATGKDKDSGLLSPDRVASFFSGLDRNKRTIAYCQTSTRSTVLYLEMRLLGFREPANWDDSWVVWANQVKYPVENEQWYNLEHLKKLEKQIKKLEEAAKPKNELAKD
jgi:thiosulfate/3-mercaptopyruvate sulfurtransferase